MHSNYESTPNSFYKHEQGAKDDVFKDLATDALKKLKLKQIQNEEISCILGTNSKRPARKNSSMTQ